MALAVPSTSASGSRATSNAIVSPVDAATGKLAA